MKFLTLRLRNFMSLGDVTFRLKDQGIVLITGRNEDNPSANSNGSGKSCLWDGMAWALYGKPIRDLSGESIIHTLAEGPAEARLTLLDDQEQYWSIQRSRDASKTTLTLGTRGKPNEGVRDVSGQTVTQTQAKILSLVGLDHPTFCSSVVFGQDSLRFAQLSDKEKKQVLEKLLSIDLYEKAYKLARQELVGIRMASEMTEVQLQRETEALQVNTEKLKQERAKATGVDSAYLKTLKEENSKLLEEQQILSKELPKHQARHNESTTLKHKILILDQEIEELEALLTSSIEGTCNSCGQALPRSKKLDRISESREAIDQRKALREDLQTQLKKLGPRVFTSDDLKKLTGKIGWMTGKISENFQKIREMEKEAKAPSDSFIQHLQKEMKVLQENIAKNQVHLKKLSLRQKRREYWQEAFSPAGIRSYLLDNVTPFLNDRAAHYSQVLTEGRIQVKFNTLSRLKSGEMTDKFSIEVNNKSGAPSYQANSAGERQRIDLCVALSLKDLARSRGKASLKLMVFDEVFDRLDASGCEKVIQLLHQEKETWGSCFVISHNESLKSYFSQRVEMVKRDGISSLEG